MKKTEFTLNAFNRDLRNYCRERKLNFCQMLLQAYDEDLSVTARHTPPDAFCSLDEKALPKEYYYGVSPHLDGKELVEQISSLCWQTAESLDRYVSSHGGWFMAHPWQKDRLRALAVYIVIVMASHYGLRILMDSEQEAALRDCLRMNRYSDAEIGAVLSREEGLTVIYGCPTAPLLDHLRRFRFLRTDYDRTDRKSGKREILEAWRMVDADGRTDGACEIEEVFRDHVGLVKGRVFYSGVLLKPTGLEIVPGYGENDRIRSVCVCFERSTYGTVCALDSNMTDHPLLRDWRGDIIALLREDDKEKLKLERSLRKIEEDASLGERCTAERILKAVGDYLDQCWNVNQIGVSANIVTGEGLLLLGQRNAKSIDEGMLYPGVNGNAEVADSSVSFYSSSVYEDYPTIHLLDDRIDFFGEIAREAYGELKIDASRRDWICYGMILSGTMPRLDSGEQDAYGEKERRLHFNLLFEHQTARTFQEIEQSSKKAAEAFETRSLMGVALTCGKNRLSSSLETLWKGLVSVVRNKTFIQAVIALILFLPNGIRRQSFLDWYHHFDGEGWQQTVGELLRQTVPDILTVLFVVITLIQIGRFAAGYFRRRKRIRSIRLYEGMSYEELSEQVRKAIRLRGGRRKDLIGEPARAAALLPCHPAAYACLRAYVDNKAYDTYFAKDRRERNDI